MSLNPFELSPSPLDLSLNPLQLSPSPFELDPSPLDLSPSPFEFSLNPLELSPSPLDLSPSPLDLSPSFFESSPRPKNMDSSRTRVHCRTRELHHWIYCMDMFQDKVVQTREFHMEAGTPPTTGILQLTDVAGQLPWGWRRILWATFEMKTNAVGLPWGRRRNVELMHRIF